MGQNGFFHPESIRIGDEYFYKDERTEINQYIPVKFYAYRPHPAEILVSVSGEIRLIHRRYLFSKTDDDRE